MNKGFFLLLVSLFMPLCVLANDPFAAHQPSPGNAMLGMGTEPPSFDAFDMFNTQPVPEDVIIKAYDVRRGLMCQPELNKDYIATIERMIRDVSKTNDDTTVRAYAYNLRRYERLANISMENPFSKDKHATYCDLLSLREEWVKQLLTHCFKLRLAQQMMGKISRGQDDEFANLDDAQKKKYEEEYRSMCDTELAAVKKIQKDLEPLEEELLRDTRSFTDKYGLLIGAGITLAALVGVVGLTGNVIQDTFSTKKSSPND